MTITWGSLKTDIRTDLKDPNASRWSDASLFVWLKDAVRDYSSYFPLRKDSTELTASDSELKIYPLPTDYVDILFLEAPENTVLEIRDPRPGTRYADTPKPYTFHIDGGSLILSGPPDEGDQVLLTYHAIHSIPASESDDSFVFTVPDADMELLRLYVYAKAHNQLRGNQARLDRFKETGRRDDNPIEEEVVYPMWDYRNKLSERFPGGNIKLYRPGRVR